MRSSDMSRRDWRTVAITAVLLTVVIVFVIVVTRGSRENDMESALQEKLEETMPATTGVDCRNVTETGGDCTVQAGGAEFEMSVSVVDGQYIWSQK